MSDSRADLNHKSEQERVIYDLSRVLLGDQALFRPVNYKNGTKEPADLVWISGKCAVFIYMTSGKRSFDRKRRHNYSQMHRWMRHWESGAKLIEACDDYEILHSFENIEYVVGLSIVGGEDTGNIYEERQVKYKANKLMVSATLSDEIFYKLASRSVGIRDVVQLLDALQSMGERIDNEVLSKFIDEWAFAFGQQARNEFAALWTDKDDLNDAWHQTRDMFRAIKLQTRDTRLPRFSSVLADLDLSDAIWLSVAERSLARQIAKPGEFGVLSAGAKRLSSKTRIMCAVGAHAGALIDVDFKPWHFVVCSFLELGPESPIRMVVCNEYMEDTNLICEINDLYKRSFR